MKIFTFFRPLLGLICLLIFAQGFSAVRHRTISSHTISFSEVQNWTNCSGACPTTYRQMNKYNIDIDLNGTNDLMFGYEAIGSTVGSQNCMEGTIQKQNVSGHWILAGIQYWYPSLSLGSIIDHSSTASTTGMFPEYRQLISHVSYDYYLPSGSTCNGQSTVQTLSTLMVDGTMYMGFKIIRNGMPHFGWLKIQNYSLVDIAWEDIPGYPIRIGATESLYLTNSSSHNYIAGFAYNDLNNNCVMDANENGMANVNVTTGVYSAVTNSNGYYFIELPLSTGQTYTLTPTGGAGVVNASCGAITVSGFTAGGQSISKNISITPGPCPEVNVMVNADILRRCARGRLSVQYNNTGSIAATSVVVYVVLPKYLRVISSSPAWSSISNDTIFYNIASISAFSSGTISIVDSVACGDPEITGMIQCVKAGVNPVKLCVSGSVWNGPDVVVSGACLSDQTKITLKNRGSQDMTDSLIYTVMLDDNLVREAKYKLQAGESVDYMIPTHGKAIRVEVTQVNDHPRLATRVYALEGCGSGTDVITKGIIDDYPYTRRAYTESTSCIPIVDSYDPNDKQVSPAGHNGFIEAGGNNVYTIRFQNTGSASAINVVIEDTLTENLDISTLQILSSSYSKMLYYMEGTSYRLIRFTFLGINLATKASNELASQGYVTFSIKQKEGLIPGDEIRNKAQIYFDYNPAVITNEVVQEIGTPFTDRVPAVLSASADKNVCTGDAYELNVSAKGANSYQWFKNNVLLSGETDDSYLIDDMSATTDGVYTCRIEGVIDTIYTNAIDVTESVLPDLAGDTRDLCSSETADLNDHVTDNNSLTGNYTFWTNAAATIAVTDATTIATPGTYYAVKTTANGCSDTTSITLVATVCSSVLNPSGIEMTVYPNPVRDQLVVESPCACEYVITDMTGITLMQGMLQNGANRLNVAEIKNEGSYVLIIKDKSAQYYAPIIKY